MSKESRKAALAKCAKLNRNRKTHTVTKDTKSGMFSCVKIKSVRNSQFPGQPKGLAPKEPNTPSKPKTPKTPPKPKTPFSKEK